MPGNRLSGTPKRLSKRDRQDLLRGRKAADRDRQQRLQARERRASRGEVTISKSMPEAHRNLVKHLVRRILDQLERGITPRLIFSMPLDEDPEVSRTVVPLPAPELGPAKGSSYRARRCVQDERRRIRMKAAGIVRVVFVVPQIHKRVIRELLTKVVWLFKRGVLPELADDAPPTPAADQPGKGLSVTLVPRRPHCDPELFETGCPLFDDIRAADWLHRHPPRDRDEAA